MRKFAVTIVALLIILAGLAANCSAQISVDNVIVHLAIGSRPVHNVVVSNNSPVTAYVMTEVRSIPDPAKDPDHTVPSTDLLASPKAFSIEPNGQRTVRLLLKSPPGDIEKVFRVSFAPQDRGFGEEFKQSKDGRKAVIRVLTGMGILVFADPKKPTADLKWTREGDKITFTNSGTIHVHLSDGKNCNPKGECQNIPAKRMYPGTIYHMNAAAENTVSYTQKITALDENQKLTIAPKGS